MNIARRFTYFLALPAPMCTEDAPFCFCDSPTVDIWWNQRRELAASIEEYNEKIWRLAPERNTADLFLQLVLELDNIGKQAEKLLWFWRPLFNSFLAGGSALLVLGRFVPTWQLYRQTCVLEFSEMSSTTEQRVHQPLEYRTHLGVSLVFETTLLEYLCLACHQQRAALCFLTGNKTECADHLEQAIEQCKKITDSVLPLHFPTQNKAESWLIAPHFYNTCILGLLEAQQRHFKALMLSGEGAMTTQAEVDCVGHFLNAATLLRRARRTGYVSHFFAPLDQLALSRYASALLMMAVIFEQEQAAPELDISYANRADMRRDAWPSFALLVEAIVCARVACILVPSVQKLFDKLVARAQTEFNIYLNRAQIDIAGCSAQKADEWRKFVRVEFESGDCSIQCNHRVARTDMINLDETRHFVIRNRN